MMVDLMALKKVGTMALTKAVMMESMMVDMMVDLKVASMAVKLAG